MIATNFQYTAGAYITCGMQSALDHCRYCNAQKRRGDYEWCSLDEFYSLEDESSNIERQMEQEEKCNELYQRIAKKFGQALAEQLKPVIFEGETKLSKRVLAKCKTNEFREFLDEERLL